MLIEFLQLWKSDGKIIEARGIWSNREGGEYRLGRIDAKKIWMKKKNLLFF